MGPQTHFSYPNSNVKSLGPVKVTMKQPGSFMVPRIQTGADDERLYNQALSKVSGANVVLDYVRTTTLYVWPLPAIYWTEEVFEGTAARMETGQQGLQ